MGESRVFTKRRALGATLAAATAALVSMSFGATVAQAAEGDVLYAGASDAIKDSYIVVFKRSSVGSRNVTSAAGALARYGVASAVGDRSFPIGTLGVNVVGSFLLGVLLG